MKYKTPPTVNFYWPVEEDWLAYTTRFNDGALFLNLNDWWLSWFITSTDALYLFAYWTFAYMTGKGEDREGICAMGAKLDEDPHQQNSLVAFLMVIYIIVFVKWILFLLSADVVYYDWLVCVITAFDILYHGELFDGE